MVTWEVKCPQNLSDIIYGWPPNPSAFSPLMTPPLLLLRVAAEFVDKVPLCLLPLLLRQKVPFWEGEDQKGGKDQGALLSAVIFQCSLDHRMRRVGIWPTIFRQLCPYLTILPAMSSQVEKMFPLLVFIPLS